MFAAAAAAAAPEADSATDITTTGTALADTASPNEATITERLSAGAAGLSASGASTPPPSADATAQPVVAPVRTFLHEAAQTPGQHRVTLTLTPGTLGELRVQIETTAGGSVRAAIVATTPEAKAALEMAADSLRQTLEERGLRLQSFAVRLATTAGEAGGANGTSGGGAGNPEQQQGAFDGGPMFWAGDSGSAAGQQGRATAQQQQRWHEAAATAVARAAFRSDGGPAALEPSAAAPMRRYVDIGAGGLNVLA